MRVLLLTASSSSHVHRNLCDRSRSTPCRGYISRCRRTACICSSIDCAGIYHFRHTACIDIVVCHARIASAVVACFTCAGKASKQ